VWRDKPKQSCVDCLEEEGFVLEKEIPDGRCLLRALARRILGDPAYHDLMRKVMVYAVLLDSFVLNRIDWEEEGDVFCDVEDYIINMFCPDTYGDCYVLLAFVSLFKCTTKRETQLKSRPLLHILLR